MEFVEAIKIENRICSCYFNDYKCGKCPLDKTNNGKDLHCNKFINTHPEEAEKIIMKWSEEHPIKTNGSKFLEDYPNSNVSGYRNRGEILCIRLDKSKPANKDNNMIEIPAEWWNKEYKEVE